MYTNFFKRIFDIIFSIIALPFLLIITLFVEIAIKIEDRGPVFYKAKRIGKDSKIFDMYKFRSMKVNAPNILNKDGSTYNSENDSRVTKVGKILRKTSIDELPQIYNVLLGQMSFIGPRASGAEVLDTYKEDEIDKMKVKPGITGYSQAYYRNSIGVREKRLKDAWYANNVTFWLDVKIFFKTIVTVLKRENVYTNSGVEDKKSTNKGYLLLANGNKESQEVYESKDKVKISSMRRPCLDAISSFDYDLYMGVNRKYASSLEADYKKKITMYDSSIYRSIFNFRDNYRAYKNLNKFLKENKIDVIHCNTPIGGFLGRICGHKNHIDKIIYTAHGFHFFKGNNPLKNLIFRSIEKWLAKKTDVIITINKEDYEAAKKFKLKENGKVYFTHGVGVNLDEFTNVKVNKCEKRKELGLKKDDIVLISVGDINDNKNISLLLDIIKELNNSKIKCLICGKGVLMNQMIRKAKSLELEKQVQFLGFRKDIKELLKISDIYISTSKREGLPRALMEAMATGLPCIVSDVRGNHDLIQNNYNGKCCNNISDYKHAVMEFLDEETKNEYKEKNMIIIENYIMKNVVEELKKIYRYEIR